MRSRVNACAVGAAVCLALLSGSMSAQAQSGGKEAIAKVEFQFEVGDKTLPSGTYRVSQPVAGMGGVTIRAVEGDAKVTVPVITRLARTNNAARDSQTIMVFDKVGDKSYLSEVWIPGQDGFLVRGTTEEHKHAVVTGK